MAKEFDTYIDSLDKLPQGKEHSLIVRSLAPGQKKYKSWQAKAILSSSGKNMRGGDTLYIRSPLGKLFPETWKIKIIELKEVV